MCFRPRLTKEQEMFEIVFSKIKTKMIEEEGIKYVVYKDSLGFPTAGIGHLIRPEDNMVVGQKVSEHQVNEWFKDDITASILAAIHQAQEVGEFEEDFVIALTSVNFQLGVNWPSEWPNTYAALKKGNLQKVIDNVMNSLWNKQTPKRTKAFKMALLQEMKEKNKLLPTQNDV